MTIGNFRPATVLIDETAILHNIQHEVARLKKQTQLFAVVKADAYGHGMLRVARVAKAAGATGFCVAILDEALGLRKADYSEPVLVLGIVPSQYAAIAAAQTISLPVSSTEWLEQALPVLEAQPELPPLRIHLALDTGMGRIGFTEDQALKTAVAFVEAHPKQFVIEGSSLTLQRQMLLMILTSNSKLTSSIIWSIFYQVGRVMCMFLIRLPACGMRLAMAI